MYNLELWILDMAHSMNIFTVYTVNLAVRQFLQAEHGEQFFNFSLI